MKGERGVMRPDRSPKREAINTELDDHSTRIKEMLKKDVQMLYEYNAILRMKCKKVSYLYYKTELVLRQNAQLLNENEKMSRYLHQQKMYNEAIRNQYDSFAPTRSGNTGDILYKKQMLNQIDSLSAYLKEIYNMKNSQINYLKAQFQLYLQALKRQHHSAEDVYEVEIRKLRYQLDKREHYMAYYANRLKKNSYEVEYDILRLKEYKEKLKNYLEYAYEDRKKDLDNLKQKLDANYLEEIETLKRSHLNSIEELETENIKYQQYIAERNMDLYELSLKLNKKVAYYEDSIALLKRDNDGLKGKLVDTETMLSMEMNDLKVKLNSRHDNEIDYLQHKFQRQVDTLQKQIRELEDYIQERNIEIEQLIKEKVSVRSMFDTYVNRLKEYLLLWQSRHRYAYANGAETSARLTGKLNYKYKQIEYLDNLNKTQRETFEKEQLGLHKIIESGKAELTSERMKNKYQVQALKEYASNYKVEAAGLKETLKRYQNDKEKLVSYLKNELTGTSSQLGSKVDGLVNKNRIVYKENYSLKNLVSLKDRENKAFGERLKASEERERKLYGEIDELRSKIIKKYQKSNYMMLYQKQRLYNAFGYSIENLKIDHEAALRLESSKIAELNDKLKRKYKYLEYLLLMYKRMRDELYVLTHQEANKKDITLKFPGATADLIATKNLFDVYLKTKVLQVCGDALEKENQPS